MKISTTIGLYFWPDCYLKFVENLDSYLRKSLTFVKWENSYHSDILKERNQTNVPIGRIGDVEIVFLHYSSEEEAREKWERRLKRINYDRLLIKCSMQNGMTEEQVVKYDSLNINNKIIFVPKSMPNIKSSIWFRDCFGKEQVNDDVIFFNKYIDLDNWINNSYS